MVLPGPDVKKFWVAKLAQLPQVALQVHLPAQEALKLPVQL